MIAVAVVLPFLVLCFLGGFWAGYRAANPRVTDVSEKWAGTERDLYPRHKRPGGI